MGALGIAARHRAQFMQAQRGRAMGAAMKRILPALALIPLAAAAQAQGPIATAERGAYVCARAPELVPRQQRVGIDRSSRLPPFGVGCRPHDREMQVRRFSVGITAGAHRAEALAATYPLPFLQARRISVEMGVIMDRPPIGRADVDRVAAGIRLEQSSDRPRRGSDYRRASRRHDVERFVQPRAAAAIIAEGIAELVGADAENRDDQRGPLAAVEWLDGDRFPGLGLGRPGNRLPGGRR